MYELVVMILVVPRVAGVVLVCLGMSEISSRLSEWKWLMDVVCYVKLVMIDWIHCLDDVNQLLVQSRHELACIRASCTCLELG